MAFATKERGVAPHQKEGGMAKMLERQTSQLPSDLFLWLAGGSIAISMVLQAMNQRDRSLFVGQWAPTFLILGLYNKLVKLEGSE